MTEKEIDFIATNLKIGIWVIFFCILSPESISVNAQPTAPAPGPDYPYGKFTPSIAIVIIVFICAFFFMGLFTLLLRHDAAMPHPFSTGDNPSCRHGLDPSVIESFPVFVYAAVKDLKIGKGCLECAVCLSDFEDDDTLRLMPKCDHVFHPDCIDSWLAYHVTCPVCRADLSPKSSKPAGEKDELPRSDEVVTVPTAESMGSSHVVIDVDENSRRKRISGKFPRSHSTGHSLSQLGENMERYTLRLPEEVRKQLAVKGKLKRTRSYDVVLGTEEGSSRGKKSSNRWVFTMTPPFVSRGSSVTVKSPRKVGGEVDGSSNGRTLLTSVRASLDWLNLKVEPGQQRFSRPPV